MIVVADTSPLRYLILTDTIHVLPRRFETVLIPPTVASELRQPATPVLVRTWMANSPPWLRVETPKLTDPTLVVDPGETEAILLALDHSAPLLIDDRKGRRAAVDRRLTTIGTLTVLFEAGGEGLLDFTAAVGRLLSETNFRVPADLLETLLARDALRKK